MPRHRFKPGSCRVPESVHMRQGWLAVQDPELHPRTCTTTLKNVGLQNASKPCSLTNRGWAGMPFAVSGTRGCEGGDARRTSRISGWATNRGPYPRCVRTCSRRWSFDLRKARNWEWDSIFLLTYILILLQKICAIRRSGQHVSGCEIMGLPRMGG